MEINLSALRAEARQSLRGRHPSAFLVSLAFYLILLLLAFLRQRIMMTAMHFPEIIALSERMLNATTQAEQLEIVEALAGLSDGWERAGEYVLMAIRIMNAMLTMGFMSYCLGLLRGEDGSVGCIFDAFGNFFRFLGLNILIYLVTSALTILLIIPGIVMSYAYALAPYLLMDDPRKGPIECMRESRSRMRGFKAKLFLLDLSMIGWILLSILPGAGVYTLPYYYCARANFYRAVTGQADAPKHVDISV